MACCPTYEPEAQPEFQERKRQFGLGGTSGFGPPSRRNVRAFIPGQRKR